jgi:hypothetical protein
MRTTPDAFLYEDVWFVDEDAGLILTLGGGVWPTLAQPSVIYDPDNLQVSVTGSTASLTWDASPSVPDDYVIFRRTPQTGAPFDPEVDTPIGSTAALFFDDEDLSEGDYDWQVFGRSS